MVNRILDSVFSLFDSGYGLVGKTAVLSVVLLFFLVVNCLIVFFNRKLSPHKVKGTILAALLGFAVLLLDGMVRLPPPNENALKAAFSLIVMLCAANFLTYLVVDIIFFHRMDRQVPDYKRDLTTVLVYLVFGMAALRYVFKLDIASILTTTTVLTAAIAFAMQTTLANIVSSFYVQNDFNLHRNTWVSIPENDILGEIVNVGFRYTTIRTVDNQKVLVPNNHIMQNIVRVLGSKEGEKSAVHIKVGLGYDFPPEKAVAMLRRILLQEPHVMKDPPPEVWVRDFLDSSVEYDMRCFLDDYSHRIPTRSSVLKKVWYAVAREGYSIPFPHREVISKEAGVPFSGEAGFVPGALERAEILRSLDREEIRKLAERVRVRVFAPGEEVVRQGDEGDSLFIVRRGALDVRIDGASVGSLREGSVFGEMSLLTGEKRAATVIASTEVRLIEISKEDIEPVIRANPRLLESLSAILAQRQAANVAQMRSAQRQKASAGKDAFLEKLRTFFGLSPG